MDGEECLPSQENISRFGLRCIAALQIHEDAPSFLEPVKAEEVPDYYDVIKVHADNPLGRRNLSAACLLVYVCLEGAGLTKGSSKKQQFASFTYLYCPVKRGNLCNSADDKFHAKECGGMSSAGVADKANKIFLL